MKTKRKSASKTSDTNRINIKTRSGLTLRVQIDYWKYKDEVTEVCLDFNRLKYMIDSIMLNSFRTLLLWHIERYAPSTINHIMDRFTAMVQALTKDGRKRISKIKSEDILNYHAHIGKKREYYFGTLRSFFNKWHDQGLPGVSRDAIEYLNDLRVKNNPRGTAVATLDPISGPFSTIEREALIDAIHVAYAEERITPKAYHLLLLFSYFGARPIQYASLKVADIKREKQLQNIIYKINIPRAKRGNKSHRSEFTERIISRAPGDVLWEYVCEVDLHGQSLGLQAGMAPLFPDWTSEENTNTTFQFHHSSDSIRTLINREIRRIHVRSERTGQRLSISPIRFRRTIATNAAREGKSVQTIASILDHTDTQTAMVYVGITPEVVARIDEALAMDLAPLAQAFNGKLYTSSTDANITHPPNRIIDLRIDRSGKTFGSCGQYAFCGFNAPIACYTCRNFEPWLDGPHEAVLESLLKRRLQLEKISHPLITESNDRTILAVAEVINLCREKSGQLSKK